MNRLQLLAYALTLTFVIACGPANAPRSATDSPPAAPAPAPGADRNTQTAQPSELTLTVRQWAAVPYYKWKGKEDVSTHPIIIVPEGRNADVRIESEDVEHLLKILELNMSVAVDPQAPAQINLGSVPAGTYSLRCTSPGHEVMSAKLVVLPEDEYAEQLDAAFARQYARCPAEDDLCLASWGQELYESYGCKQCHSISEAKRVGPSFKDIWGQKRDTPRGPAVVDEEYIKESLYNPTGYIREGFSPVMPNFQKQLSEEKVHALSMWIKSLGNP